MESVGLSCTQDLLSDLLYFIALVLGEKKKKKAEENLGFRSLGSAFWRPQREGLDSESLGYQLGPGPPNPPLTHSASLVTALIIFAKWAFLGHSGSSVNSVLNEAAFRKFVSNL